MFDLLKQVDFLENFALGKIIFHIRLLDSLDSHILPSKLMNAKGDFTKRPFAYKFYEFVIFKGSWWKFVVFLDIGFYELYQPVSFLNDCIINFRHVIWYITCTCVELRDIVLRNINVVIGASRSLILFKILI
jgi:hypothetical protein